MRVEQGDTASAPYGWGTSGSRSVAHGGSGVLGAARLLAAKLRRIAAHALEAAPEDVVLSGGRRRGEGDRCLDRVGGTGRRGLVRPPADPRRGAGVGGGASLRLRRAQLPVWDPPGGGRGRPVHWRCGPATDVGGGRRRCDRQPDAGRWSAPRRARPRNRSGYVGRGSLRPGRQPAHRLDGRLPAAHSHPAAQLRAGGDLHTQPDQPAGGQGCRRGRTLGSTPAVLNAAVDASHRSGSPTSRSPPGGEVWQAIQRAQGAGVG